jgi:ADP-ribose pyrophosphatase YjhB (NUDIX family)
MNLPSFVYPLLKRVRFRPSLHWRLVRLLNTHFLLGVAGIITDDAGRLLLFHHTYRRRHPWGMPGGWMHSGESPLQALEREVFEESRMTVKADRLLLVGTTPDRPKLEFAVGARLVSGTFQPSREVSKMGWFAADEYPPLAQFHHVILSILADKASSGEGDPGWYEAPWVIAHPR